MNDALKKALQKIRSACFSLLAFFVSAVFWIVSLFIGGSASIVSGVNLMLGPGPALITAGAAMLCACFLLKRAVTNG
jgi:hypothetical protein